MGRFKRDTTTGWQSAELGLLPAYLAELVCGSSTYVARVNAATLRGRESCPAGQKYQLFEMGDKNLAMRIDPLEIQGFITSTPSKGNILKKGGDR